MKKRYIIVLLLLFSIFSSNVKAKELNIYINKDSVPEDTYIIGNYLFNRKTIEDEDYVGDENYIGALITEYIMLGSKSINVENNNNEEMKIYYKNLRGDWINPINNETINDNEVPNRFSIMYINNKLNFELSAPTNDIKVERKTIASGIGEIHSINYTENSIYKELEDIFGENFVVNSVLADVYDDTNKKTTYRNEMTLKYSGSKVEYYLEIKLPNATIYTPKTTRKDITPKLDTPNLYTAGTVYENFGWDFSSEESGEREVAFNYTTIFGDEYIYSLKIFNYEYDKINAGTGVQIGYDIFDAKTNEQINEESLSYEMIALTTVKVGESKKIYAKAYVETSNGEKKYSDRSEIIEIGNELPPTPYGTTGNNLTPFSILSVDYNIDTKKFVYHVVPKIDYAFADSYVYEQVNNEILGMNPDYYYIIMNSLYFELEEVTVENIGTDHDPVEKITLTGKTYNGFGSATFDISQGEEKCFVSRLYVENSNGQKFYGKDSEVQCVSLKETQN